TAQSAALLGRASLGPNGPPVVLRGEDAEEEDTGDTAERGRAAGARPRNDVLDEDGAGLGPVALPQLAAGVGARGCEEQGLVDPDQAAPFRRRCSGVDVFEEDGAGLCPVAGPRLAAGARRRCREKELAHAAGEGGGVGVAGARVDVPDEHGTGLRPVALPELGASAGVR